jgi:tripartite-type tricarboxylate transporter receptor subunit TctC
MRRPVLKFALAALATLVAAGSLSAQTELPSGPVRVVVPFAPGGSPDIVARLLAPHMSQSLGRQVIVENRPGAGGTMAAKGVADAEPNGATLLMTTVSTQGIAPALFPNLSYDPVTNFTPITLVANVPLVLVAEPNLPATDLPSLLALLKANPGKYNYASSGVGAPLHLAGELFKSMTSTEITHVAYRGSAPALTDLMAGRVALFFGDAPSVLPQIEAKTIRPIGVATAARFAALPAVPTIAEAGLPGFEAYTWNALFAPAGLPKPLTDKLNAAALEALARSEVRQRLEALGYQVVGSTPEALGQHVKSEIAKWGQVVRAAGVKLEQ